MLAARIKKTFPSNAGPALTIDVEFTAGDGIAVLFGPSGAGKTTILRSIAGLVRPDEGRIACGDVVYFDSATNHDRPIQLRRVGYVFQDHVLFPHLTARQNVAYGARPRDGQPASQRVDDLMSWLGIAPAASRYPRELSGGEQQRVGIARALASDPAILLLDEPLSAVDLATRSRLLEEITAIQHRSGVPFLYVTHNHNEAVRVGNLLFVLDRGRIVQSGPPLEVFNAPQTVSAARVVGTENIFFGRVAGHQPAEGLTRVDLPGCPVEIGYNPLPVGTPVTVGIRSEEIVVARERLTRTSARNVIEGTIQRVVGDAEKVELIVACGVDIKVSVTPGTVRALGLEVGAQVFLLAKARAFHLLT